MTDREARAARNRQESLDAFLAEKAHFDAMVAELQRMSADHFGADPEAVLWGEHATLRHWNSLLAQRDRRLPQTRRVGRVADPPLPHRPDRARPAGLRAVGPHGRVRQLRIPRR